MNIEEALDLVEKVLNYDRLNKIQEIVFRQSWEGQSYSEIARNAAYEPEYIKQVGFQLWQLLSKAIGKKVTKNNFQSILKRYVKQTQVLALLPPISLSTVDISVNGQNLETGEFRDISKFRDTIAKPSFTISTTRPHQDWGEAIDVSAFYGRTTELLELEQWIVQKRCRLVTILGMGGIGKTAVAVKLAQEIQGEFEYLIWRSLCNAPLIEDMLAEMILFLSQGQETDLPETVDGRILRLINYLRNSRCLLVLDNAETILRKGDRTGS
jgi:ATP-dependent Clp protease ATP-binding subunit ClpA